VTASPARIQVTRGQCKIYYLAMAQWSRRNLCLFLATARIKRPKVLKALTGNG
jgi:hypothetical protein